MGGFSYNLECVAMVQPVNSLIHKSVHICRTQDECMCRARAVDRQGNESVPAYAEVAR
jgi:hypothetical protein